jgi:hypothetical protein
MKQRATFQILLISIVVLILAGCSTSVSYKPPLLPVKLVIDNAGNISVVGEVSFVTFIGEFSIGAEYTINSEPDSIIVIVRDQNKSSHGLDNIYRVRTGGDEFTIVLNGETTVQVMNKQVIIDVTNSDVKSIEFKRAESLGATTSSGLWGNEEHSYRPFKVMQKMIDKDTWLSNVAALLLFPVELIAVPLAFLLRLSKFLFGDIGLYGAFFVYVIVMVISGASKSQGGTVLAVIMALMAICAGIVGWLS